MTSSTNAKRKQNGRFLSVLPYNLFVWFILLLYLLPIGFMITTAFKPTAQLSDKNAPLYPARIVPYTYEGKAYQIYNVPTEQGIEQLAMVNPGTKSSEFVSPEQPEATRVTWEGNWRSLTAVYEFAPTFENFSLLANSLSLPKMAANTLLIIIIGEVGVLAGFSFEKATLFGSGFPQVNHNIREIKVVPDLGAGLVNVGLG